MPLTELLVGQPAHGGHCVARVPDGEGERVVFVRHALPGERVRVTITEHRSSFLRGEAVEILEPSADRVDSPWPEAGAGGVGGGELAHASLPAQRRWKQHVLAETLRRIGGPGLAEQAGEVPEPRALPGDDEAGGLGYRTRVSLTVAQDGTAGMHAHRGHEIRALGSMPLAAPGIADLDLLGPESPWRLLWHPGARLTAVAPSADEPLLLIDGKPASLPGRRRPRRSVRERVSTAVGPLDYRVDAAGFWQVHRQAPAVLAEEVLAAAAAGGDTANALAGAQILELYAGAGLLTLPLAHAVGASGAVMTVEGAASAVQDARRNLAGQDQVTLGQARIDAGTVREAAAEFGGAPDVVVLDPPRAGAGAEVMAAIAAVRARRVVLVSCDPAALARDAADALDRGYRVERMVPLDFFPHTHHVEVVTTLVR